MKLLHINDVPRSGMGRSFGHRPWGAFLMTALWLGVPAVLVFEGVADADVPWWIWAAGSPVLLIVLLVWLLVLWASWRGISACFHRGNWVMKVAFGGLYLKFRSYLNHHFPDSGPVVVFLPWSDILTAGKAIDRQSGTDSDGNKTSTSRRYLDLRLKHNDTEPLRRAIAAETARKPRKLNSASFRFHHSPVQVPEPDLIRVEWRGRGMLKALQTKVEILPTQRTGHGIDDAESQIVNLIENGDRMSAIRTVRDHYGMTLQEARTFVDDLAQSQTLESIDMKPDHA